MARWKGEEVATDIHEEEQSPKPEGGEVSTNQDGWSQAGQSRKRTCVHFVEYVSECRPRDHCHGGKWGLKCSRSVASDSLWPYGL